MKKLFYLVLVIVFLGGGALAEAQQQAKVPKIGFIGVRPFALSSGDESLGREHPALDYAGGKNKVFENRSAEDKVDRLHALADELIRLNVDVLIAPSTPEALAFKKVTKTIPVVFMVSTDPVADGLVESLARPGGNITGVTTITPVLAGKRLELLKETIPKLTRVAVLWNPQDPSSAQTWKESRFAGRELGLELHSMEVSAVDKLEGAFKEAVKARSAALAVTSSPFINFNEKRITDLAAKYRLPAIFDRGEFVASGGLMSYGPDESEQYRRVAYLIDRVLKGAKPAELPVERPMGFEFIMNLKTAKALNLTIPPIVLMRVTKVIK